MSACASVKRVAKGLAAATVGQRAEGGAMPERHARRALDTWPGDRVPAVLVVTVKALGQRLTTIRDVVTVVLVCHFLLDSVCSTSRYCRGRGRTFRKLQEKQDGFRLRHLDKRGQL